MLKSVKIIAVAIFFLFAATVISGVVYAASLNSHKAVFGPFGGNISPTVNFESSDSGDLYVAIMSNNNLFFLTDDGYVSEATPFKTNQTYSGSIELFEVDSMSLPAGRYQLYQIVTDSGSDVFDSNNWHGGESALNSLNFIVGQSTSASNDFDNDGWPDDDSNKDGFHDDDTDRDGFHQDDTDHDGYHQDDADRDGYHDDDLDRDGYHDDDHDRDGFHDSDTDKDGFYDDDRDRDGRRDNDDNDNDRDE